MVLKLSGLNMVCFPSILARFFDGDVLKLDYLQLSLFYFPCRMKPGAPRAPKATESNARSSDRELLYPFGHQNDLGHVVLTRPQVRRRKSGDNFYCFFIG